MNFDIKKLYKSTIKTLEKHQMEVTIAIAALSMLAFGPEDPQEALAHKQIIDIYKKVLNEIEAQLVILNEQLKDA